jgi:hypothetical protein
MLANHKACESLAWYTSVRVNSAIRCTRYAGRFGNDDLDNAGFAGDVTTVSRSAFLPTPFVAIIKRAAKLDNKGLPAS